MIPTGLKLYVGIAVAAATAAVIGGYTSGGDNVGPLSAGYKGGIGDQVSYSVLLGVAAIDNQVLIGPVSSTVSTATPASSTVPATTATAA